MRRLAAEVRPWGTLPKTGNPAIVRHSSPSLLSLRLSTMAYTRAVAVVLGSLFVLTQTEVVKAGTVHVISSSSGSSSGASQSQVIASDGTIKGQCAYVDPQGRSVKISYRQSQNGQIEAEADPPMNNAVEALETCRRAAKAAASVAQESILMTQQELQRQHQELQNQIFLQNQAMQQAFQFPKFFAFPQQFPFGQHFP